MSDEELVNQDFVICQLCGKKFVKITNTHLKTHKINISLYKEKFPNSRTEAKKLSDYRKKNIKGKKYEEIYGKKRAIEIKKAKSEKLTKYNYVKISCKYCKKIFEKKENDPKEFCSLECKFNAQRKGFKNILCLNCGKELIIRKNSTQKFCGHKCSDAFQSKKSIIIINCPACGKNFSVKGNKLKKDRNLFCSKECRKKYTIMYGKGNYRNKAYELYGKKCDRCGATENILVHHKDGNRLNNKEENLQVLCRKCHSKIHNEMFKIERKFVGQGYIEQGMILMLKGLQRRFGLDISDVNFQQTPKRVARAYEEIFEGINATDEITEILSTAFPTDYTGMVALSPIRCYSMCPHHFLPVIYDVSVAYIANKGGLGLSKIPRLIELLSKAPKLQEQFTHEIIDTLDKTIKPKGCIVVVKGEHMCMQMRGVKKPGCATTTSAFTGIFKDPSARAEFFSFVDNRR